VQNLFCGLECKIYFANWSAKFILRIGVQNLFCGLIFVPNLFCGLIVLSQQREAVVLQLKSGGGD